MRGQGGASNDQLKRWKAIRWKGRTDLYYLATRILGYDLVTEHVHGPVIRHLQQFPRPEGADEHYYDQLQGSSWKYKPFFPDLYKLPGTTRKMLLLDPRGWFKTTINIKSHTIQWLLNYPNVSMYLVQSTNEKAEEFLQEIKNHFIRNPTFRDIYPDYCPQKKLDQWGNRQQFVLPNRNDFTKSAPSVTAGSIDKSAAGKHVDVIKFSDIVDEQNSKTPGQLQSVINSFGMFRNVLIQHNGYVDVEGTRYDFSDLYGKIIDGEYAKKDGEYIIPPEKRQWRIFVRGVYKKDVGDIPYTFSPEELEFSYLKDEKDQFISWWPEMWPVEALERYRKDPTQDERLFSSQQLNNPIDTEFNEFEYKRLQQLWMDPEDFKKVPIVQYTTTVDTAETDGIRSDYSAITTAGWGRDGKIYIADVRHGKFLQDRLIQELFEVMFRFRPVSIKIEETAYIRGLRPTILRRLDQMARKTNLTYWPLFEWIKRDTQIGKTERIRVIQPWFKNGDIRFLSNLACREALTQEFTRFPKYQRNDILDTIADQFQNREWFGRLSNRLTAADALEQARKEMLKISTINLFEDDPSPSSHHDITGGL